MLNNTLGFGLHKVVIDDAYAFLIFYFKNSALEALLVISGITREAWGSLGV